jgi:hypothetical protein
MYRLTKGTEILRSDGALIPVDPKNVDYIDYVAWLSAGHTPDPVAPPTPAELQAIQDAADAADARTHAKLTALKKMTPAQVQAWVTANVTNLAQAQDAISTLAVAVGILARRL